ncbi:unnamed protein product [Nesidiocoris tenuis]|uniref:Uncharacterized protein n=1 Tax=Nesidiocoris tenuis TaxID=355587 RepID=A0A6H5FXU0_9HEMI|nr:unnamed protein product [Nesidiocoris tenuis]
MRGYLSQNIQIFEAVVRKHANTRIRKSIEAASPGNRVRGGKGEGGGRGDEEDDEEEEREQ